MTMPAWCTPCDEAHPSCIGPPPNTSASRTFDQFIPGPGETSRAPAPDLYDGPRIDFSDPLGLDVPALAPKHRDNADPHAVILTVHPRQWVIPYADQWEADYDYEVQHPASCSDTVEDCPVTDCLDVLGTEELCRPGFPEPDHLTDDELAVLDGTVRYITMTRTSTHYSGPDGDDYDCDYDTTWHDVEVLPTRRTALRYVLIDLAVSCDTRQQLWDKPLSSPDLSDLYERALDRIDDLYAGTIDPHVLITEIDDEPGEAEAECEDDGLDPKDDTDG